MSPGVLFKICSVSVVSAVAVQFHHIEPVGAPSPCELNVKLSWLPSIVAPASEPENVTSLPVSTMLFVKLSLGGGACEKHKYGINNEVANNANQVLVLIAFLSEHVTYQLAGS
jgi:hypothetical protein